MIKTNIFSVINIAGLAAIAAASFCGVASAATVDVYYRFEAGYYLNCEASCETEQLRVGDFEARFNYRNVVVKELAFDVVGPEREFELRYGGETTARFTTPIGDISFQGIGRGFQDIILFDRFPFLFADDNVSSIFDPSLNTFNIGGSGGGLEGGLVSDGASKVFSLKNVNIGSQREGLEIGATFRLQNATGDFVTNEFFNTNVDSLFNTTAREIRIAISDLPVPSAVPLPATAPLLFAAIGLLGWRSRRRMNRASR